MRLLHLPPRVLGTFGVLALATALSVTPFNRAEAQSRTNAAATTTTAATAIVTVTRAATATAARATRAAVAPVLDGRADDAAWAEAQVIDQFLEYEPDNGKATRFRTEVRVVYDDRNLYVLARMFDPAPDSIVSLLSRRDVRTSSEQIKLVIDSYHDRKTAFQFITNPAGVKRDYYVSNDNTVAMNSAATTVSRFAIIRIIRFWSSGRTG